MYRLTHGFRRYTGNIPAYLIKAWVKQWELLAQYTEYTLGDMSIPRALVTGTGYIHEPIPLKLGFKWMALNSQTMNLLSLACPI